MTDPSNPTTEPTQPILQSHADDSPHRHATLKKKGSINRGVSKASKADNTGSTTLSPTSPHADERQSDLSRSPLYCPVPTNADPTVVLAMRFQAWRGVIKNFINYFKSISSIEDTRSRNIAKLNNSLSVPFRDNSADEFFLEFGGIQDIGLAIKECAKAQALASSENSRKILSHIVPPLEKLRSDLHLKIKEIKGLSGDFKNSVSKEQDHTRRQLHALSESLTAASERPSEIAVKNDPHLVKMAFEKQLRHHLQEENFLHQAHRNIESSGRALEGLVVKIIREAFSQYQEMLSAEATATSEFAARIGHTGVDLPFEKEWDAFISVTKDLVDPSIPIRTLRDIDYPGVNQVTLIRSGRLERKSKYLKSYSSAFYILTAVGYFHEFKNSHMADLQVSLFLPSCTLGGHSSPGDKSHKFVLKGHQGGGMHRGHNWVFRAETHAEMLAWYHDIEQLVRLPHMSLRQRQTFIASHAVEEVLDRRRQSGSSSPGLDEDEADDVPYSQINSIEEPTPQSPLRPPPGGSFPSQTKLDDVAMYRRHSRAASDVTDEFQPARILREEDGAAVFDSRELDRPITGRTQMSTESIGDDRNFSAAGVGAGVEAAVAGRTIMASRHKDRGIYEEAVDYSNVPPQVTGPHEAARYYAGTAPMNQSDATHSADKSWDNSIPSRSQGGNDGHTSKAATGGVVGGLGGTALATTVLHSKGKDPEHPETSTYEAYGGIETKLSVPSDVLPTELNGSTKTSAALGAPIYTIRRSKSKKEIVEETIAESMGNHPERGVTPGGWPETPVQEIQQPGLFK